MAVPPVTDLNESAKTTPAASTLPKEPVEIDEPLTPPPTKVDALELSSPRNEPLIIVLKLSFSIFNPIFVKAIFLFSYIL